MAIQSFKENISESELYPYVLQATFLKEKNIELIFDIVTYHKFKYCFNKIVDKVSTKKYDLIIFQIRGHYYLDLVSIYSTYKVSERGKSSKKDSDEDYQKKVDTPNDYREKLRQGNNIATSSMRKLLVFIKHEIVLSFGYIVGYLFGAEKFAQKNYAKLLKDTLQYANENTLPIVFLGVTSRPNSKVENLFSSRLNQFSKKLITSSGKTYLDIFGKYNSKNEYKFFNTPTDKISLNQIGHREVAEKLKKHI